MPLNITTALMYECKLAIDSDGVSGASDREHQGQTSLRINDDTQTSLDAEKDSFAVIPLDAAEAEREGLHKKGLLPEFGVFKVSLGDIGVALWEKSEEITVFVVGDKGPPNSLGEGSIKMADNLGVPSNPANGGFNSNDVREMRRGVMHIVFPGSTDVVQKKGHFCTSRDRRAILDLGRQLFDSFRNQPGLSSPRGN